ncbi:PerC family transcriptional regulator [Escherichia coli]|nr:PerC family transcriptional regulator [Escherichia coli]EJE9798772.1 PerC family transcriptional regulator [Escherichia coli]
MCPAVQGRAHQAIKHQYRRAAARWAEVMQQVNTDKEREQAVKRRAECIHKAARSPVILDNFGSLREAANRTQADMGIEIAKSVWRNYQTDKVL